MLKVPHINKKDNGTAPSAKQNRKIKPSSTHPPSQAVGEGKEDDGEKVVKQQIVSPHHMHRRHRLEGQK